MTSSAFTEHEFSLLFQHFQGIVTCVCTSRPLTPCSALESCLAFFPCIFLFCFIFKADFEELEFLLTCCTSTLLPQIAHLVWGITYKGGVDTCAYIFFRKKTMQFYSQKTVTSFSHNSRLLSCMHIINVYLMVCVGEGTQ